MCVLCVVYTYTSEHPLASQRNRLCNEYLQFLFILHILSTLVETTVIYYVSLTFATTYCQHLGKPALQSTVIYYVYLTFATTYCQHLGKRALQSTVDSKN